MNYFLIVFLLISSLFLKEETRDYAFVINAVEKELLGYNNHRALAKIDSILVNDFDKLPPEEKYKFQVLKIEALTNANLFSQSLDLTLSLTKETELSPKQYVRVLLNNALAYEYVGNFDACKEKLDLIENIYNTQDLIKDHLYAKYLYRKASYYRVQRDFDDLAFSYSEKAKAFAVKNNYKSEGAVASMLLGFLEFRSNPKLAKKHFELALSFWEEVDDKHGMSSMYMALADIEKNKGNYSRAIWLCDKSIELQEISKYYGGLASAYHKKSKILEKSGRLDAAIEALKLSKESESKDNLLQQEIKVNEIKFGHDIEKAKLKNEELSKDLEKRKQQQKLLLLVLLGLLIVGAVFMILSYRLKKKNIKIKEQREQLDISLKQKKMLLQELHHRVKNNLAMILSLVRLQENNLKNENKVILKDLENRIETIALAHNQFLYSENKDKYCLLGYIDKISTNLVNLSPRAISLVQNIETAEVSIDSALPIGIIINELITNSIKYANVNGKLVITIDIHIKKNVIFMSYQDNGAIVEDNNARKDSLGLVIIQAMVRQLQGTYKKTNFNYEFSLYLKNE